MEALKIRYVNEKLLQGLKKLFKNSLAIRHSVKELLAKNSVTQPIKYTVGCWHLKKTSARNWQKIATKDRQIHNLPQLIREI